MERKMNLKVAENLSVEVTPDASHGYLMTTEQVAIGYGVSDGVIRTHKIEHREEFIEGKHFISLTQGLNSRVGKTNADTKSATYKKTLWTKRGIIRLGFFVKSARAKLFRDWAEDLVLLVDEQMEKADNLPVWPETGKRNHNRLTQDRLIDILADVALIDDKKLRVSIVNKLIIHQ